METTIMENQMEKKMENEMETRIIIGLYWERSLKREVGSVLKRTKELREAREQHGSCRLWQGCV